MTPENAILVENVSKTFRDFWLRPVARAVSSLTLAVPRGSVFGLLGPNGSGKSTTLKMILGLLRPDCGKIEIFGKPPASRSARRRIGYLPELSYLHPFLTARETILHYAALSGMPRKAAAARAEELLEETHLSGNADRRVGTFSKGMARRVAMASALVAKPDLLVLDEPTSGLDPIGTREVKNLIRTLAAGGMTILTTSHLLGDAEDISTHLAILSNGRLAAAGEKNELLQQRDVSRFAIAGLDEAAQKSLQAELAARFGRPVALDHPSLALEEFFSKTVEEGAGG